MNDREEVYRFAASISCRSSLGGTETFQILRLMHGRTEVSVNSAESGKGKQAAILPISRQLQHVQATTKYDDITTVFGICLISSMVFYHIDSPLEQLSILQFPSYANR